MEHGALVLLPLLSLELPMLQAFWLLARGIGEGPASPFQPVWKGRVAVKSAAKPYWRRRLQPQAPGRWPCCEGLLVAQREGWTWLSTIRMFFVIDV